MSNSSTTLRSTQYDRLKRRLERFNPSLEYARLLKQAAEETLADNPIGSEASPEEIGESIRALLPPPQIVFTREYFSQTVFPVTLVKDVASLYGCLQVNNLILEEIDEEEKADSVAMTNAWLAHAYNPVLERVFLVLDMYETARIFGPLSLTMPLSPQPKSGNDHPASVSVPRPDNARSPTAQGEDRQVSFAPQIPSGDGSNTQRPPKPAGGIGKGTSRAPSHSTVQADVSRASGDPTKKAAAVEQYFRTSKYSGDLSQSLQNTIRDYNVCAMQLELDPRQKALFFINVFCGTARDYFFEHCREDMSYDQLVDVMKKGFDNNARQLAIEAELETLTLDKVMKDNDITDINQGLTKLTDRINSLFPQMPMQSQYPKNKVRFLRKAVLEQDWAKASIAQIVTADFGFDDLLTSLREQYQLEREVQEAKNKSGDLPSTLYQQYGRRPGRFKRFGKKSFKHGQSRNKRLNPIGRDGKRMTCSWCGSNEHFVKDCPPGAPRSFVRSRLEKGVPAVHICHDLLHGIEELASECTDDCVDIALDETENPSDAPSELHIFDKLSSEEFREGETPIEVAAETGFFDKLEEDTAINFIASKFADKEPISVPQPFSSATGSQSDFREDF